MEVKTSREDNIQPGYQDPTATSAIRVEIPSTGESISIESTKDQRIEDILHIVCIRESWKPSNYKCKLTFKDKRIEFPSNEQLLRTFEQVEFVSIVCKDGPKRTKSVLSKSNLDLEIRSSQENFPKALAVGLKTREERSNSYSVGPSETTVKRTGSMNEKGETVEVNDIARRQSYNTAVITAAGTSDNQHVHLPSANSNIEEWMNPLPPQTVMSEERSSTSVDIPLILQPVDELDKLALEVNVPDCENDTFDPIIPDRVSSASKDSRKSLGDILKPLIPMNLRRKNTYRTARRESVISKKVWEVPVSLATTLSRKPDEQKVFLVATLPSHKSVAIKTFSDMAMDDLLNFICIRHGLLFEVHTFQLNGKDPTVELDRPLSFYLESSYFVEMFVVPAEKKYRSNVIRENGKDVMVLQNINGRLQVISGTADKLIERLSDVEEKDVDNSYMDTMLLTFRSFMTTMEFFQQIIGRFYCVLPDNPTPEDIEFYEKSKEPTQIKILKVLLWWIENHWHDFTLLTELRNQLDEFVDDVRHQESEILKMYSKQLLDLINLQTVKYEEMQDYYRVVARRGKQMESMLMQIKPEELGQQLCLHNFKLFRNIHEIEFLNQIWLARREDTPYLNFFIERFDKESFWVATEIVKEKNLKKRILASVQYNNFFSLFSFVSGLNLSPVSRLKKTWDGLPEPIKKVYAEIEKLADPSRNMKNYRDLLGKVAPPIVPFLPIYLKDLTFMNDGNPKLVDGLINFDKLRMMGSRVKDIISLAEVEYQFVAKPAIQNFIAMPNVETNLAKLKEMSLLCEKQVKS
ncbi:ras GEF [Rhizoclosmatium globosum]|uniref:Ras GEF n=1 Tax=Rhizoclosmatium globosum TaxID=329046 RepID=A0A1Y2CAC9_9FUNG|nr:ras GEF [Rhizoclosmatium globosum]|eukprot:ORY43814.1 ras GEF [Rhizoclosmatium globosum]